MLPLEPVLLALNLESRGISLTSADGDIVVSPFSRLTPEEVGQLRRWKTHLLALMACEVPYA